MNLTITTKTKVNDLMFDYFEFETKEGKSIVIGYDTSEYSYHKNGMESLHLGVTFDDEDASGQLSKLEGAKFSALGVYSETQKQVDLEIEEMTFEDGEKKLLFKNPYAGKGVDASG